MARSEAASKKFVTPTRQIDPEAASLILSGALSLNPQQPFCDHSVVVGRVPICEFCLQSENIRQANELKRQLLENSGLQTFHAYSIRETSNGSDRPWPLRNLAGDPIK
jgi:hypothetical protein